jgi:hypothetical protein
MSHSAYSERLDKFFTLDFRGDGSQQPRAPKTKVDEEKSQVLRPKRAVVLRQPEGQLGTPDAKLRWLEFVAQ